MFLGLREMRYAKLRYALVVGVIFLVAYVVFMLGGLANGLAQDVRQGVEQWGASEIVLSNDANKNLSASSLSVADLARVTAAKKAGIGQYSGAINLKGHHQDTDKLDISLFGVNADAFVRPTVIKGRVFKKRGEIIIPENLVEQGFKLGDEVNIGKLKAPLKVVGIFQTSSFNVAPLIYTSIDQWQAIKYGTILTGKQVPINAIATRAADNQKVSVNNQNNPKTVLQKIQTADFIENLPGYSAQNLTLNTMIYFLFVITAAIIGIFMYVMTMQKASLFGVMKAQGISNAYIGRSIVAQTFILSVVGVGLGLVVTLLTALPLPVSMPFTLNPTDLILYSVVMVLVAVIGGLFSIRTVTKIDPLKAIGG